jgi:hypothetical protein
MENGLLRELKHLKADIANGNVSTSSELAKRVLDAFSTSDIGLELPRFVPSEPPSSVKVNFLTEKLDKSLRDREYIFDLLLAAGSYEYDQAMKYLDSLEDKVLGLSDTVKTLYFYSKPTRSNIHTVGADFTSSYGLFKNSSNTLKQTVATGLTLPVAYKEAAVGELTANGDGMAGCWYALNNDGVLIANIDSKSELSNLLDSNPTTSFEYGRYRITSNQYNNTKGYGFGFSDSTFKWASPSYNSTELDLEFSLSQSIACNYIQLHPSVSSDKFVVDSITLYLGGVNQGTLTPRNLIVNQELLMHSENGYTNSAAYMFESTIVDKLVFKLKSSFPIPTTVRHYYAVDSSGVRISSESPSVKSPHAYNSISLKDGERLYEDLPADRFYIGLKDITVQSLIFGTEGVASTKYPIKFGKPIDRVALFCDYDVPAGCEVKFEVSFDEYEWYTINPLGTTISNQVLCINDMRPTAYQDPSTKYITLEGDSDSLSARISASRKSGTESSSPVIRNLEFEVMLKD